MPESGLMRKGEYNEAIMLTISLHDLCWIVYYTLEGQLGRVKNAMARAH